MVQQILPKHNLTINVRVLRQCPEEDPCNAYRPAGKAGLHKVALTQVLYVLPQSRLPGLPSPLPPSCHPHRLQFITLLALVFLARLLHNRRHHVSSCCDIEHARYRSGPTYTKGRPEIDMPLKRVVRRRRAPPAICEKDGTLAAIPS